MTCFNEIASLLIDNKIRQAILRLQDHIMENPKLKRIWAGALLSNSSLQKRADIHFENGRISWEDYNISYSKIVVAIEQLANEVCQFIENDKNILQIENNIYSFSKQSKHDLERFWILMNNNIMIINKIELSISNNKENVDEMVFELEKLIVNHKKDPISNLFLNRKNKLIWLKWLDTFKARWEKEILIIKELQEKINFDYKEYTSDENKISTNYSFKLKKIFFKLELELEKQENATWKNRYSILKNLSSELSIIQSNADSQLKYINKVESRIKEKYVKNHNQSLNQKSQLDAINHDSIKYIIKLINNFLNNL